jgi:uncharacterized DUF497 family protein
MRKLADRARTWLDSSSGAALGLVIPDEYEKIRIISVRRARADEEARYLADEGAEGRSTR